MNKRTKDVRDYLLTTLENTYAEVTGWGHRGFIYKGFIYTPAGTLWFDTGIDGAFITKKRARQYFANWQRLEFPGCRMGTRELLENWVKYGPWDNRVFCSALIRAHLPQAEPSHA